MIETNKSRLVGNHLGESENNTKELVEPALGAAVFDAEFGLSDVKQALDAFAQRKVTRAAITITRAPKDTSRAVADLPTAAH